MLSIIARILASGIWVAASVFLATTAPTRHHTLRVIAAVVVGAPGAAAFAMSVARLVDKDAKDKRDRVRRSLNTGLLALHRSGAYPDDITRVSFHVWVVPMWYRRLVPYRIRRRRKPDDRRLPERLRPRLQRLALHRFEQHEPSGVIFRKGIGLVGRCIDLNDRNQILIMRFNSAPAKRAMRDEATWANADINIHHNLKLSDARTLAQSYSQAAAIVIRERSGDAIGCVTLELPTDCKVSLGRRTRTAAGQDPLLLHLKLVAQQVENHLTRKP
jgi:hypothetical protein